MKLGLMKGKKKRELRAMKEQKESQVLVATISTANNNIKNKNYRRNTRK